MSSILVTGAAGYIGSVLTPILLARGYAVTAFDTFAAGDTYLAECCHYQNFTPIKGDVRDETVMAKLIAKHDIIIPLAAIVGAPLCTQDPMAAQTVNYEAIAMMLKYVSNEQKIVFPCTNSGYGIGQKDRYCTEETPLNPISLYGTSKRDAEKAILDSGKGVTFRLATVFGMSPCMRIDLLVNDFTYRAVTDNAVLIFEGHFKRNYIHVRDVVKAFLHGIDNFERMRGQVYNLGLSSANLSKLELCAKIKEQVPNFTYVEAAIGEDPDKRDYIVSNEKLENSGWTPDWPIEKGIQELLKGYVMLKNRRFSHA
jgi:nucleoside-diphosphate-sugar epimerase